MNKTSVIRLISQFVPAHYDLSIAQSTQDMVFSGIVKINGRLPVAQKTISLHADNLNITSVIVNEAVCTYSLDAENQLVVIDYANAAPKDADITIVFDAIITKQMHGLYPCYFEHAGKQKSLLATQFESHHAREVFPCIDEPEAKATFKLITTTSVSDVVLSNTPLESELKTENSKLKTCIFETTPLMSTYLLAWVSGELIYEEQKTAHGVTVRAYSTPVHKGKLAFGLDTACKSLDYMDDYFAIPYPLPKCDIIALPDFAAGAMENWGCVTFRESAMLVDPEHSDLSDKQHVAEVVIHELAHQWFGNLVTMRWWNDLWLNEGFASWVPYLVMDDLFPDWKVWEHFSAADLAIGMKADALNNTHPIVVEIKSPSEIRSAFDSISYDKGCSVINLLYEYIGAEAFKTGLRNYLKKHAYNNSETSDLWQAWSLSSGKDVVGFMSSWTEKPGFPILTVSDNVDGFEVSQKRFFIGEKTSDDTTIWPVPLMRSPGDTHALTTSAVILPEIRKLNLGQRGFYRTVYQGVAHDMITKNISDGSLSAIDITGVLTDTSEAAKAGYISSTHVLDIIKTLSKNESEVLVTSALGELGSMRGVFTSIYEQSKPFTFALIEHNLNRLGIEQIPDESVDDELLRPSIIASASYSGHNSTVDWALEQFEQATSPTELRADVRSVIYQTAAREIGTIPVYEKILRWYELNEIPGERTSLASTLVSFKDKDLIDRSLQLINSPTVKLQDALYWIAYALMGRDSKHQAWAWLKHNWQWVGDNFGKEKEIDYFLRYAANNFASDDHLKDYTDFFSSVNIFGSTRAYEQGKEIIAWQAAWKKRDEQKVLDWLTLQSTEL